MSGPSAPPMISTDGKFYWDGQRWVAVPLPPASTLNESYLPANQRRSLTARQALRVVLKEIGKGWNWVLLPAVVFPFPPVVFFVIVIAIALTPVFAVAAILECILKLRVEEGAMRRTLERRLFFKTYKVTVGQSVLTVSRTVHASLVDGGAYCLYMTPLSRILVNFERLDLVAPSHQVE